MSSDVAFPAEVRPPYLVLVFFILLVFSVVTAVYWITTTTPMQLHPPHHLLSLGSRAE